MPGIVVGHLNEPDSLTPVFEEVEAWNPGFRMGSGMVETDEAVLTADRVRHIWLAEGEGRVFLDKGYRTKEGDGSPLPEDYVPDAIDPIVWENLTLLSLKQATFHQKLQTPVGAVAARLQAKGYVGDIAGEIWLILESGLEPSDWSEDREALDALQTLINRYRTIGWSEKQTASFEPIQSGDQLTVTPQEPLKVGGRFRYWWIESDATESHISAARRLNYLKDTAGGCNFAFDAFRRLPLTWYANTASLDRPDGINRVNSHVVNIAAETSQTHYHPATPVGGGTAQSELYLVLDPGVYGLKTYGRNAYLNAFPELHDLANFSETPLTPGATVYIRPDTGHRGIDVFVNVITLPGFKPRNEIYIDRRIKEEAGGKAPYNSSVTG